jgi:rfaE bifunctional protein nucleotidyltransferase chain/domain
MISDKVVPLEELQQHATALRTSGKRVVATNGCFDLLHVGHVRYLNAARELGDALIVGINGDQSVRELKGAGRPVNSERDRAEVVAALECVDLVAIFPELRAAKFLELAAPDVYVKGGDYNQDTLNAEERQVLQKIGAKIDIVPFERGYSTSDLLARLSKMKK